MSIPVILFIVIISTFVLSFVSSVDICQGGDIKNNYDYEITSPKLLYSTFSNLLDCNLNLYRPTNSLISIAMSNFWIKDTDYLDIIYDNKTVTLDEDSLEIASLVVNVTSIQFHFHFKRNSHSSFTINYGFITTTDLDNLNGIVHPTLKNEFIQKFQITEQPGWTRFVSLQMKHEDCSNTEIKVYYDNLIRNGCRDRISFYQAYNITFEFISHGAIILNNYEIQYKTMRKKGVLDCNQHFDCDDTFCIPIAARCDGKFDCYNKMDEMNC